MSTATMLERLEVRRLEQASEWLLRLREDAVSDQEMQQWLDWCETDPANLQAFERIQSLWRGVPAQSAPMTLEPPREIAAPHRWRTRRWQAVAVAAGVVLAVGAGLLHERLTRLDSMVATTLETPLRSNRNTVLPDGSQVDISAGSKITLEYTYNKRQLAMDDGMAFFQVATDRSRPFVVDAGAMNITALGTAFNIRRHGGKVVVTVTEGVVKIEPDNNRELRAEAGYQVLYDSSTREVTLRPADPGAELAWRHGRLVYDGESLDVVVDIVNRYSTRKISLGDPKLGRIRYTGTVFTDSIDGWLEALPRAFPVTAEEAPGGVVLRMR
jgi:transmembrane sensor